MSLCDDFDINLFTENWTRWASSEGGPQEASLGS